MSDRTLEGHFGVVTGAFGPIGRAMCEAFVEAGASVLGIDRPGSVQSAIKGLIPLECDLLQMDAAQFVAQSVQANFPRLDFLVNNAAFTGDSGLQGYGGPIEEQTDATFEAALRLNLRVPFSLVRELKSSLDDSPHPAVLNISSIYGLLGPVMSLYEGTSMGNPAAYAASKGGLVQLTRYLATTLAPKIRVNCIALGGIERGQAPEFIKRYTERTPLGRMGKESDLIGAAMWLVSDQSAYVTGQTVAVDGGWTAW